MFVRATLTNGTSVISEFGRLTGIRKLSADVLGGRKAFPVWTVVGDVHPANGQPCTVRTRSFISGAQVLSMEAVVPTTTDHGYSPENFTPEQRIAEGPAGLFRFTPEMDLPEGAVANIDYPTARDPESGRRFIVISEGVTHFIDPERQDLGPVPGMGDENDGFDPDEDWDDEASL